MFFGKSKIACEKCKSKLSGDYSYCPYCGNPMLDIEKNVRDFGMIGKNDAINEDSMEGIAGANVSFIDKVMESAMNGLVKSIEKQMRQEMKEMQSQPRISNMPNGIKIKISHSPVAHAEQPKQSKRKAISPEQMERLTTFPRTSAKTNIRRLPEKVVYELAIPGLVSADDVFVSKLERGYEIKAIGNKKVYVNSLPVELPIKSFAIEKDKLLVEFKTNE